MRYMLAWPIITRRSKFEVITPKMESDGQETTHTSRLRLYKEWRNIFKLQRQEDR